MATTTRPSAAPAVCPDPGVKRARRKKTVPTVYTIIITKEPDGHFSAYAPALNDCGSFGDTLLECLLMTEEALWLYLDLHRRRGWEIPADNPTVCVDMTGQQEVTVYRLTIRESSAHA